MNRIPIKKNIFCIIIIIDKDGVCNACKFHDKKRANVNWSKQKNKLIKITVILLAIDPTKSVIGKIVIRM